MDIPKTSFPFLQLRRDVDPDLMKALLSRPPAWVLLTLIALRARRSPGIEPRTGEKLEAKEALVGDHEGMSRGEYRSALGFLKKSGLITTRTTNRGTVAMLVNSAVYNINPEPDNHLNNQQGAEEEEQPASNHQNDHQNDHQSSQPATTRTTTDNVPENTGKTEDYTVRCEPNNHQNDQQTTTDAAHEQPASNQQTTNNKNVKKEKNEKNHHQPPTALGVGGGGESEDGQDQGGEDAADLLRLLEKYPPSQITSMGAFLVAKREKLQRGGLTDRDKEDLQTLRSREERDWARSDQVKKERERAVREARDLVSEVDRGWEIYQGLPHDARKRIELRAAAHATPGGPAWKAAISKETRREKGIEGLGSVLKSLQLHQGVVNE